MVRAVALGLAVLALFPTLASAHGPSRQKVTETVEINAPADKVWAVIGNFQDMSWHPAIAKLEGSGGNDANATRTLTLTSGGTIDEKLLSNDPAKKIYKYEITKVDPKVLPVNNYSVEPQRQGRGRQIDGRVERRLLPRVHEQRSPAGAERRGGGEGREGRLSRRPRCSEDESRSGRLTSRPQPMARIKRLIDPIDGGDAGRHRRVGGTVGRSGDGERGLCHQPEWRLADDRVAGRHEAAGGDRHRRQAGGYRHVARRQARLPDVA